MLKIPRGNIFIVMLSIQIFLISFPFGHAGFAQNTDMEGFIIEADRVIGEDMTASLVYTETSKKDKSPMLRFRYKQATIYGMRLTKQFSSPNGVVSLTMHAQGPVTMSGMTVDASAISFKGACIHAAKTVPQAGLNHVTMMVHYMHADSSNLEQLKMQTVSGEVGPNSLPPAKIIQDLALLPASQIRDEINKIMEGKLPLTCSDETAKIKDNLLNVGGIPGIGKNPLVKIFDKFAGNTSPLDGTVESATGPLDSIANPLTEPLTSELQPVLDTLKPVTHVLKPVTDRLKPATGELKPITDQLKPVTDQLKPVTDQLKPVTDKLHPITGKLQPVRDTLKTVKDQAKPLTEKVKKTADNAKSVEKKVEAAVKPAEKTIVSAVEETTSAIVKTGEKKKTVKDDDACTRFQEADETVTKEVASELMEKALKENKPLTDVCGSNKAVQEKLDSFGKELIQELGLNKLLVNVLNPPSQEEKLTAIIDNLEKKQDGALLPLK
ncbi:hypothetical protein [Peribacillus sp. SCS-155]|uniref:hypothetical protein n=1 Tax=Peribacillus sedimenti TaxID=3115297 RepID=UPI0039065657